MNFKRLFQVATVAGFAIVSTACARHSHVPKPAPIPGPGPAIVGIKQTVFALEYVDMVVGTGPVAELGRDVTVHYTGWLVDSSKFDSSFDRNDPIKFVLGQGKVIPGWDYGLVGMKVGGKRRLIIPYQLAYGTKGRQSIPPSALLTFDVELIAVDTTRMNNVTR